MKLSIIIPAFNEEKTINEIIKRVKAQKLSISKEIIVVDDGSKDNTYVILKEIKGITLLKHENNKGKGRAIRTGLAKATGEIVLIQDADLELTPKDYPALIKPILEGKSDVVFGSRIIGNPKIKNNPLFYFGGRMVTLAANLIYNIRITDEPIGYKVFRTELLRSLNLKCEGFEFCPEVTAKVAKRKIKIIEVPVSYFPRTVSEGKKVGVRDGFEAVWTLIKYRFKD